VTILLNWIVSALAIMVVAFLLPGVIVEGFFAAFVTAVVLGLVNAFLRPILILLTLPITIVSLGLSALVINALLIMLTGAIVPGFMVDNFWWALLFSLILSLVNFALGRGHAPVRHRHTQRRGRVRVTQVEQEDVGHE
jgi:putative membrane protein